MQEFAKVFKALGDPTRLRMVRLLLDGGIELCVCELADSLEESQYNVSKHCAALKTVGLLESRREGRWIYYGLAAGRESFRELVFQAVAGIPAGGVKRDRAELRKRLKLRENGKCLLGIQKTHLLSGARE
jgi:ArsR family transcriptional regulator